MKMSRFTDEEIAFTLKQAETGATVAEICRKRAFQKPPSTTGSANLVGMG